jgi:hypothetical protein
MGMYDDVEFKCDCPNCGEMVDGFQSKDGPCELKTLTPDRVLCWYSNCSHCGTWVERHRLPLDTDINSVAELYTHVRALKETADAMIGAEDTSSCYVDRHLVATAGHALNAAEMALWTLLQGPNVNPKD